MAVKELEHLLVLSQYELLSLFLEKPLKFCFFYGWLEKCEITKVSNE